MLGVCVCIFRCLGCIDERSFTLTLLPKGACYLRADSLRVTNTYIFSLGVSSSFLFLLFLELCLLTGPDENTDELCMCGVVVSFCMVVCRVD